MKHLNVQAALEALEPALKDEGLSDAAREVMTRRTMRKIDAVLATLEAGDPALLRGAVLVAPGFVRDLQAALLNDTVVAAMEATLGPDKTAALLGTLASI